MGDLITRVVTFGGRDLASLLLALLDPLDVVRLGMTSKAIRAAAAAGGADASRMRKFKQYWILGKALLGRSDRRVISNALIMFRFLMETDEEAQATYNTPDNCAKAREAMGQCPGARSIHGEMWRSVLTDDQKKALREQLHDLRVHGYKHWSPIQCKVRLGSEGAQLRELIKRYSAT